MRTGRYCETNVGIFVIARKVPPPQQYSVFKKKLCNFESLYKYSEDMYNVLNCYNVAKDTRVLPEILYMCVTGMYKM
jgi:hypothetical protein